MLLKGLLLICQRLGTTLSGVVDDVGKLVAIGCKRFGDKEKTCEVNARLVVAIKSPTFQIPPKHFNLHCCLLARDSSSMGRVSPEFPLIRLVPAGPQISPKIVQIVVVAMSIHLIYSIGINLTC